MIDPRFALLRLVPLLAILPTAPLLAAAPPSGGIIPLPFNPGIPAAQRTCAARTMSGLGYTELRPGTGVHPVRTDRVTINYIGYLAATGAVFDQAMGTPMALDQVIDGFSEGVQLASRGAVMRICLPAALGYGARSVGPIPANSDLVFQIELIEIAAPEPDQPEQ